MVNQLTNLSEHLTLAELCKTNTGIANVPNEAQVENLTQAPLAITKAEGRLKEFQTVKRRHSGFRCFRN